MQELSHNNFYGNLCSQFYDLDKPFPEEEELCFYLSLVEKEMNILEPMCGSGRFLVSFLAKGYDVDGFDVSKAMIDRCIDKIAELQIENNSNLQQCGFNEFSTDKKYDFIFIPSGSFCLLTFPGEIKNALSKLEKWSKIGGSIVLELETDLNFGNGNLLNGSSPEKVVEQENIEIVFSQKTLKVDYKEKVLYTTCTYKLFENGHYSRKEDEIFNIKCYSSTEFEEYLKDSCLRIEGKYINYNKDKYVNQQTDKIIYHLKKEQ